MGEMGEMGRRRGGIPCKFPPRYEVEIVEKSGVEPRVSSGPLRPWESCRPRDNNLRKTTSWHKRNFRTTRRYRTEDVSREVRMSLSLVVRPS
jgi:hypothetical protein